MDKRVVVELIEALDRADACRNGSAVDTVCHRCWSDVDVALEAVRKVYKPQATYKGSVVGLTQGTPLGCRV